MKSKQVKSQDKSKPHPSHHALLNALIPQASTSRQSCEPSTSKGEPKQSTSKGDTTRDDHDCLWQQTIDDIEADERLAKQLMEEEELNIALAKSMIDNKSVDSDADAKLARQLAQQDEDMYFASRSNNNVYSRMNSLALAQQEANLNLRRDYNPINFSNVIIHTKSSKKMAKKLSKKHQLANLTSNNDVDTSESLSLARRLNAEPEPKYPRVYDALLDSKLSLQMLNNQKIYLPASSARKSFNEYEEITVKKMEKTELVSKDKLVSIEENFDALGRKAFAGCASLNPMQSLVFECAYKSNKNMLVAAPTGSGKTNVAMMAILNELKNYFKPNTLEMISPNFSENFKIIYIAPMKSLATEQTANFNSKLGKVGIKARELTGDMSLTEREMSQTHIIVTTPEKWDVVTRKPKGDIDLLSLVRLLIIDEIHLLQSDRGPVLEALVARTLRYVESSQKMTRIIGLSATLPNYTDVAQFLRVDPYEGLYYFDNRFRPVPLTQTFIGVRPLDSSGQARSMDKICYNYVLQYATQSKQIMIFVHARNSTQKVAQKLREMIQLANKSELFQPDLVVHPNASKMMLNAKNKLLKDLFAIGFGIHHAGMVRQDRLLVEDLFRMGVLKVLVCTATLAWGVNFPAHAVIIRGTEIYDASVGKFVDVGLLDVMQIFGRAGRPQYDSDGHAIIISSLDKMDSYLKLLTNQTPIESNFTKHLTDNLNAEIVSGTVTSVEEGMEWLKYTYLNVRLAKNPLVYGFDHFEIESDRSLATVRHRLIVAAARQLDEARMCRFNEKSAQFDATDLGRIASHFYINHSTITRYNEILMDNMDPEAVLNLIGEAQEFQQIKYREEEAEELDNLRRSCYLHVADKDLQTTKGKVSCLLQAYISRSIIQSHSLISDLMYIAQNAARIARGLFEYSLKRGWPTTTLNLIKLCKHIELRFWEFQSPFRHFDHTLPFQVVESLEKSRVPIEQLDQMSASELAKLVNFPERMGHIIKEHVKQLPYVIVDGILRPIKSNLVSLDLTIQPYFTWSDKHHGKRNQSFWLWVVDDEVTQQIYHSEHIKFNKEQVQKCQCQHLRFSIPLVDDTLEDGSFGQRLPSEYIIFVISDEWISCDYEFPIDCRKVTLPNDMYAFTRIPTNLNQLPLSVLGDDFLAEVFRPETNGGAPSSSRLRHDSDPSSSTNPEPGFSMMNQLKINHFNLIQSMVFHPLYRSDRNILVCGPSGSGKTLLADVALLRALSTKSKHRTKIVFVTPENSLVTLKYHDWKERIGFRLQKNVALLNNRTNYIDEGYMDKSDIVVASAERFYQWLSSSPSAIIYLQQISLIVFDDMHLIADKRGSMLELLIANLNYLKTSNQRIQCRYVGLSNTVSNAQDLANWLNIKKYGAYNFNPTTSRNIQLEIHVTGFPERHYSPRMASMNKPIFKAIMKHSPREPVLVFVSSRKQCSLTAKDLISCLVHDQQSNEKQWVHIDQFVLTSLFEGLIDNDLKLCMDFGIGLLYPSMKFSDKKLVEELYRFNKIQILICTTNYAWEADYRARLVIVKGTEHYDDKIQRFTDYAPSDVMQMLGKSGRPGCDSTGISILLIRDIHKEFYKKFLHESFPIESRLLNLERSVIKEFLNFGVSSGASTSRPEDTVTSTTQVTNSQQQVKSKMMTKLSKTFISRRLEKNPCYYEIYDGQSTEEFLSRFIDKLDDDNNK